MKTKTKKVANKEMSPAVFAKRREIIALIHQAKKLVPSLPRITVRVTENHDQVSKQRGEI